MTTASPTAGAVRLVISLPSSISDSDIDEFILDAVAVADQCPGVASLSEAVQKSIVKYITAHLLSQRYGGGGSVSQESLGDASKSYSVATPVSATGLESSSYGRQALLLDSTGCLARLGRAKPILVKV